MLQAHSVLIVSKSSWTNSGKKNPLKAIKYEDILSGFRNLWTTNHWRLEGYSCEGEAWNNDGKMNKVTLTRNCNSNILKVQCYLWIVWWPVPSLQDHLLGVVFPFSDGVFTFWTGRMISWLDVVWSRINSVKLYKNSRISVHFLFSPPEIHKNTIIQMKSSIEFIMEHYNPVSVLVLISKSGQTEPSVWIT